MVLRENRLRLSAAWQKRFEEAERESDTDWLECVGQLQLQVVREFGWPDSAVHALRTARSLYPNERFFTEVPLYVRYNRARSGPLEQGSQVPMVQVHDLSGRPVPLWSFGGMSDALVIVAGSFS